MTEETLFHEAVAKAPAERAAFLNAACAGQPELRAAVEALLASHEASGSFLVMPTMPFIETLDYERRSDSLNATGAYIPRQTDRPQDSRMPVYHPTMDTGTVIAGRYVLERKLGEGGMGEVWIAKQTEPVKRLVALKLIKSGMDSKAVLARFEQERQALAVMDHPNIARVLDGGMTPTGQPFFVMELVNGLPLTRFCDEAKFTPQERLELFVPICQAVQHAHQKGIVHRDLKPANILVTLIDSKPIPKVIDFGVAKATAGKLTDESMATQFGSVVGTLEYMAPEQAGFASEDVDTRADIYSLGVILYELLTGLRPIDARALKKAALDEMIRVIREEEPSKPSTRLSNDKALPSLAAVRQIEPKRLMAMLRGELDWVVMKCLEKQRDRRYETANGLARDVQRYLADEPVEARPPSATYRFRKFLTRNKGPVAAAGMLLATLIVGIIATTLALFEAQHQADVANEETQAKEIARQNEAAQRQLAERANQQAYEALKSFTDELMGRVLGERTQLTESEKSILQNAQKQWEVFAQSKGNSPEARVIRSDGAVELALIQTKLGLYADAEANNREGLRVRADLTAEFPANALYRLKHGISHQILGSVLRGNGKTVEAETQFRAAVDVFAKLAAEFPTEPRYRYRLAEGYISVGNACRDQGQWRTTEDVYLKALALQQTLAAEFREDAVYRLSVARTQWGLAFLKKRLEQFAESEDYYRSALAAYTDLAAEFPAKLEYRRDLAGLHRELGALLYDNKHYAKGAAELPKALAIQVKLAAEFPSLPNYRSDLGRSHRDYGRALGLLKKSTEALEQFGKSEAIFEKLVAHNPMIIPFQADLGLTYYFHGELLLENGEPTPSLEWFDKSIQVLTAARLQDGKHILIKNSLSRSHAGRAWALDQLKKHLEALKDWDLAVQLAPPERLVLARLQRANSLVRSGNGAAALADVVELEAQTEEGLGTRSWTARQMFDLACLFASVAPNAAGKHQELADRAMDLLQRAVREGFKDADQLAKHPALDTLRGRDDLKKLLTEMKKERSVKPEGSDQAGNRLSPSDSYNANKPGQFTYLAILEVRVPARAACSVSLLEVTGAGQL